MTKTNIRKEVLARRKTFSPSFVEERSLILENKLRQYLKKHISMLKEVQEINILAFYPLDKELKFLNLYKEILTNIDFSIKINLAFPRTEKKDMDFYIVKSLQDFSIGNFKVYEPNLYCELINKDLYSIVLVPCVAINKEARRLGYGAGYYDRYFADSLIKKHFFIGCSYEEEIALNFSHNEYDIKIDYILR